MEEIVIVVLIRRDDPSSGFGFSLLDKPGFPPVIYDIEEDSPAAESGNVEAGDVILKINEVDVGKYSIKEVLKCLRLAGNHVSLKLKRDPVLKKEILLYLSTSGENVENDLVNRDEVPLTNGNGMVHTVESRKKDPALQPSFVPLQDITSYRKFDNELASNPPANNTAPPSQPMFEAYVMTGERLLKLTKNTSLAPKYQRKIDSLKSQNHCRNVFDQHFKIKSTPSSPVELEGSLTDVKSSSACMFPVTVETSESADSTPDSPEQRVSPSFLVNISKSDDLIQYKNTVSVSSISVQVDDEDIRLSLHALLDTGSDHHKTEDKRVQCTYNDPEPTIGGSSSTIPSSEIVLSRPFISLPLPTEVSFPLMSTLDSSSVDHKRLRVLSFWNNNSIDSSQVEMLSNISSPDYREETSDMLNVNDVGSEVIDQSDSDSSLLTLSECDDELIALTEAAANLAKSVSPPQSGCSEEELGSDVESLYTFHYSPKEVDYPSANRLAKRLYYLEGFKKSDVSRHLSKNNEFNRAVAEEYLKYFNFGNDTLDEALRKFLKQFSLTGESQERERVLVHFSKRFLDCNPGSFNFQDGVHTLTCAIMLLNTDLHGQNIGRKMTCDAFIENLSGLNNGDNFPRDILKSLYQAIKISPLKWAVDDEREESSMMNNMLIYGGLQQEETQNELIMPTDNIIFNKAQESNGNSEPSFHDYKKGFMMRKCCCEPNGKRTPFGKRGWKMMFCTLGDFVLYLHKDEQELNKNQSMDTSTRNMIYLHHALATKASDYTKKTFVFRLQTADRAEYLFQTSDNKELQSWVDTINSVCASFSASTLPQPIGYQKKFERPFLSLARDSFNLRDQLKEHEKAVETLEKELEILRDKWSTEKSAKRLVIQNYKEKEAYLSLELKRYKTYVYLLQSKLPSKMSATAPIPLAELEKDDVNALNGTSLDVIEESNDVGSVNRYSYQAAINSNGVPPSGSIR